ncbi:MAG: UDP-N-acetylmuramoylalanyl-D-glutamate--2,6-diaminopimelate ligase, partial [Armatimonadetes bacterium]|nr:UDP-N-acetylmuramoylalanyl-D-glutamate--2,6-diaminopimelate ligase [Armatimonadota bacterium]
RGRGLLVDDAYNASTPEAMEAALEVLDQLPGTRKIAVLADMLELGPASEAAHAEVGRAAARRDLRLITIGPRARGFARAAREAGLPPDQVAEWEDQEAGLAALWRVYEPGAVVLVKGSRGMALEGVVQAIQEREGAEW